MEGTASLRRYFRRGLAKLIQVEMLTSERAGGWATKDEVNMMSPGWAHE